MSPASDTAPTRARRADAERNRKKLLATARAAFAAGESGVSMAELSRRAGVGMATLYRNFPGRRELLEALYVDEVDAVCAAAATVEGASPGARLVAWLRRFAAFIASKRPVGRDLLEETGETPFFSENRSRVVGAAQPLLLAAQEAGEVRSDLDVDQVLTLVMAVASAEGEPAFVEPMLAAALDGLRAR